MTRTGSPTLLRPRDVATRFGVSVGTLRNWSRKGGPLADAVVRLPGGQRRFLASKVDAFQRSLKGAA